MKKTSLICLFVFLTTASANAKDGFYAGLDVISSKSKHNFVNNHIVAPELDPYRDPAKNKVNGNGTGFGISAGYKTSYKSFFIAPEIFFDKLNNHSHDFYYTQGYEQRQNVLSINNRYGVKANIGYKISDKISTFISYGFANNVYNAQQHATNRKYSSNTLSQIYGIGFIYDLNDKWSVKTSYDYQKFSSRYVYANYTDQIVLTSVRVGLVRYF